MSAFFAITQLATNQARVLSRLQMERFLDNPDPRNWSRPVQIQQESGNAVFAVDPAQLSH